MPTDRKRMMMLNSKFNIDGKIPIGNGVFINDDFRPGSVKFKPNSKDINRASYLKGWLQINIAIDAEFTNNYCDDWRNKTLFRLKMTEKIV